MSASKFKRKDLRIVIEDSNTDNLEEIAPFHSIYDQGEHLQDVVNNSYQKMEHQHHPIETCNSSEIIYSIQPQVKVNNDNCKQIPVIRRSQIQLVESRLNSNIQSLDKKTNSVESKPRSNHKPHSSKKQNMTDKYYLINKKRSKSCQQNLSSSRNKILNQILSKLKEPSYYYNSDRVSGINTKNEERIYNNSQTKYTTLKKSITNSNASKMDSKRITTRLNKLENMLNGIKSQNKNLQTKHRKIDYKHRNIDYKRNKIVMEDTFKANSPIHSIEDMIEPELRQKQQKKTKRQKSFGKLTQQLKLVKLELSDLKSNRNQTRIDEYKTYQTSNRIDKHKRTNYNVSRNNMFYDNVAPTANHYYPNSYGYQ